MALENGQVNTHIRREERRQRAIEILDYDNALFKDRLYLRLTQSGVDLQKPQPSRPYRLQSTGFTSSLAQEFGVQLPYLNRALLAARVDLIYFDRSQQPINGLGDVFQEVVDRFLKAYTEPASRASKTIESLAIKWNPRTISSFYQTLYQENVTGLTKGAYATYEMEALEKFYLDQLAAGAHLTPFDRLLLSTRINQDSYRQLVERVRKETGVYMSDNTLWIHLNALLYSTIDGTPRSTDII